MDKKERRAKGIEIVRARLNERLAKTRAEMEETERKQKEGERRVEEATNRLEDQREMIRSLNRSCGELKSDLGKLLGEPNWREMSKKEGELATAAAELRRRKRGITGLTLKAKQEEDIMLRERKKRKKVKAKLQRITKEDQELFWVCSDSWSREGVPWRLFGAEYSSDEAADGPSPGPIWKVWMMIQRGQYVEARRKRAEAKSNMRRALCGWVEASARGLWAQVNVESF